MKYVTIICILLFAFGCRDKDVDSPILSLELGETKGIMPAAWHGKLLQMEVVYKNNSAQSVWIFGESKENPSYGIESRLQGKDKWTEHGIDECGFGDQILEIKPGSKHSFNITLPAKYKGSDVRVVFSYYEDRTLNKEHQIKSGPRKLEIGK